MGTLRLAGITALLAIVYFAAAKLGLSLAFVNASASAVWPPTGIALAAVLLLGPRVSPGILVGAFLANVTTAGTVATSLGIAVGNTGEALLGAWLVRRFAGGPDAFESPVGVFKFVALAAVTATTVSATTGVTVLSAAGFVPPASYGTVWLTWWLGDAVGALIVAPPILLWARRAPPGWWSARRAAEAMLGGAVVLVMGAAVFDLLPVPGLQWYPLTFATIPPLLLVAFRFGARAASSATLGLSAVAIWGTLAGASQFLTGDPNESLLLLQSFLGVVSVTGLAVGAIVAERAGSEARLRRARDELEARVRDRTASLAEAVRALEEAQRVARIGSFRWELGSGRVAWSDELCRIYGIAPGSFDGTVEAFLARVHADDREAVRRTIERAVQTRSAFSHDERIVRPDGTVRHLHTWGRVLADGEGGLLGMEGICQDVTERMRADEKFRGLLESAPDAMLIVDRAGTILMVNSEAERMFGCGRAELLGEPIERLVPQRFREQHPAHRETFFAAPARQALAVGRDLFGRRRDGEEFPVEITLAPIEAEEGPVVCAAVRDISERRRFEAELEAARRQMAQSEKLSALGTLVSGVAHEVRTPLTYIATNAALARMEVESAATTRPELGGLAASVARHIASAQEGVERANRIVQQLRRFAQAEPSLEPAGLHEVVEAAVELFRATRPSHVAVQADCAVTPPLPLDSGQIQQVVLNLLTNASEAMGRGGTIEVRTRFEEGAGWIEVCDRGPGIPPAVQARLFDPFFTTKPEGTGLGLSISRRIVEAHGGSIGYRTTRAGTTFTVRIPGQP